MKLIHKSGHNVLCLYKTQKSTDIIMQTLILKAKSEQEHWLLYNHIPPGYETSCAPAPNSLYRRQEVAGLIMGCG